MSFFRWGILGLKIANGNTTFVNLCIIENIFFSCIQNGIPLDAGKKSYAGTSELNFHRQFDTYLVNIKLTVKIWSIFVALLEIMNFNMHF